MGFDKVKLKVQLKMAITRLKMLQAKKSNQSVAARKEIGKLLEKSKEESARIKVEHIIREDYMVEAMELIEMYCDLLLARFGMIESMKYCDESILEAVASVMWASPRLSTDVAELQVIRDQFIAKYGREFGVKVISDRHPTGDGTVVSQRLVKKFSVQAPSTTLVNHYLIEIASVCNVDWTPPPEEVHFNEEQQLADLEAASASSFSFADGSVGYNGGGPTGPNGGSGGGGGGGMSMGMGAVPSYGMPGGGVQPSYAFPPQPQQPQQQQYPPQLQQQQPQQPQQQPQQPQQQPQQPQQPKAQPDIAPPSSASYPPAQPTATNYPPPQPQQQQQQLPSYSTQLPPASSASLDLHFPSVPASSPGGPSSSSAAASAPPPVDDEPDFDLLTKRFNALKKR